MTVAGLRVKGFVDRIGSPFTAGGVARRGVFCSLLPSEATRFAAEAAVAAWPRPMWKVLMPGDDPTATGSAVVWGSRNLTVRAAHDVWRGGEVVARWLVVS